MKPKQRVPAGLLMGGLISVAVTACSAIAPTAPSALAMTPADTQAASTAQVPAIRLAVNGTLGAQVFRERQLCFLLGIAADGTPYPLDNVPCEVQLVLTQNGRDIGSAFIKAVVPNESGRVLKLPLAGNPSPRPCVIEVDSDGDGTPDLFRQTTQYTATVSVSGRLHFSCQFPG